MIVYEQLLYISSDGDPLWFTRGLKSTDLIPTSEPFIRRLTHRLFSSLAQQTTMNLFYISLYSMEGLISADYRHYANGN